MYHHYLTPEVLLESLAMQWEQNHGQPMPCSPDWVWPREPGKRKCENEALLTFLSERFPGFVSDGCTASPDWDLKPFCIFHDLMYWLGAPLRKRDCDRWLGAAIDWHARRSRSIYLRLWYRWLAVSRRWATWRLGTFFGYGRKFLAPCLIGFSFVLTGCMSCYELTLNECGVCISEEQLFPWVVGSGRIKIIEVRAANAVTTTTITFERDKKTLEALGITALGLAGTL